MSNASSPPPPAGLPATCDVPPDTPAVDHAARGTRLAARPPTIGDYLHLNRYRIDGWTPTKVAAFIEVLGETGSVTRAAAYVAMTTASAYRLRGRPGAEPFAEAWEAAIGTRHERLADLAMERIESGVERGHWWRGQLVGFERVYSDRLLMFMLSATSPDRVRRSAPATGAAARAAAAAVAPPVPGDVLGLLGTTPATAERGRSAACGGGCSGGCSGACSGACGGGCSGDCPEGECPACDAVPPTAAALYDAAIAAETALPPDVEATMLAMRERRAAAQAADEAEIAAIGAAVDAALGRTPGEI